MINKKSNIFVTGHKGLVGSAVLRRLGHLGYKNVLTIDKKKLDLKNQTQVFKFFKRNSFSNLPKEANCKRLDKKKLGK